MRRRETSYADEVERSDEAFGMRKAGSCIRCESAHSTQHWFVQTRVLKHRGYEICPLLLVLSNQKLAMCGSVYVVWDVVAANVVLYVQSLSYYTRVDFVETRTLSKIHLIELNYSLVRYIGNRWHLLVKGSVTNTENFIIIRLQRISFSTIPLARSNSN